MSDIEISQLNQAKSVEEKPVEKPPEKVTFVEGVSIDLLDQAARINLGKGYSKLISYPDLILSLQALVNKDSLTGEEKEVWLPPNTFWFSEAGPFIHVSMYYPGTVREVSYYETRRPSVIPNILICHKLKVSSGKKYDVVDTRYYCTKIPLQELPRKNYLGSKDARLSLLPFTNVYPEATLCYGNNVRPAQVTLPEMRPLHWYYEMLFNSPFNNDLGIGALTGGARDSLRGDTYIAGWYKLLADLATENKPFPYEHLRPIS